MDTSSKVVAALALHRFGMGPRRDRSPPSTRIHAAPLLAELDRPRRGRAGGTGVAVERAGLPHRRRRQCRAAGPARSWRPRAKEARAGAGRPCARAGRQAAKRHGGQDGRRGGSRSRRQIYLNEAKARIDAALGAEIGFAERLVWFWSNHFCVSADKIQSMAGAYEREAIRPHVLGRFADMLLAVESHPAMLFYLDNAASIGPNSVAGINRTRGLNENLAREILELHTLGVRTGYTPGRRHPLRQGAHRLDASAGRRQSRARRRVRRSIGACTSPGRRRSSDKVYRGRRRRAGPRRAAPIWRAIRRPPSTSPTKLARHFVADEPPPALVERLAKTIPRHRRRSQGGRRKALVGVAGGLGHAAAAKLKRPSEWVVAMRARDRRAPGRSSALHCAGRRCSASRCGGRRRRRASPTTRRPGSTAWRSGSTSPTTSRERVAERARSPARHRHACSGRSLSARPRQAVARAESRQQALALLFMSPEFQRR